MQAIRLPHRHARGFPSSQKSCLKCLGPQTRLSGCPKPKRRCPIHSALPSDSDHGPECDPRRPSGVAGLPAGLARPALSVFTLAFCTLAGYVLRDMITNPLVPPLLPNIHNVLPTSRGGSSSSSTVTTITSSSGSSSTVDASEHQSTAATGNLDSTQPAAIAGSSSSSGTGRQAGGPRRVLGAVTKPLVATATLPVRLLDLLLFTDGEIIRPLPVSTSHTRDDASFVGSSSGSSSAAAAALPQPASTSTAVDAAAVEKGTEPIAATPAPAASDSSSSTAAAAAAAAAHEWAAVLHSRLAAVKEAISHHINSKLLLFSLSDNPIAAADVPAAAAAGNDAASAAVSLADYTAAFTAALKSLPGSVKQAADHYTDYYYATQDVIDMSDNGAPQGEAAQVAGAVVSSSSNHLPLLLGTFAAVQLVAVAVILAAVGAAAAAAAAVGPSDKGAKAAAARALQAALFDSPLRPLPCYSWPGHMHYLSDDIAPRYRAAEAAAEADTLGAAAAATAAAANGYVPEGLMEQGDNPGQLCGSTATSAGAAAAAAEPAHAAAAAAARQQRAAFYDALPVPCYSWPGHVHDLPDDLAHDSRDVGEAAAAAVAGAAAAEGKDDKAEVMKAHQDEESVPDTVAEEEEEESEDDWCLSGLLAYNLAGGRPPAGSSGSSNKAADTSSKVVVPAAAAAVSPAGTAALQDGPEIPAALAAEAAAPAGLAAAQDLSFQVASNDGAAFHGMALLAAGPAAAAAADQDDTDISSQLTQQADLTTDPTAPATASAAAAAAAEVDAEDGSGSSSNDNLHELLTCSWALAGQLARGDQHLSPDLLEKRMSDVLRTDRLPNQQQLCRTQEPTSRAAAVAALLPAAVVNATAAAAASGQQQQQQQTPQQETSWEITKRLLSLLMTHEAAGEQLAGHLLLEMGVFQPAATAAVEDGRAASRSSQSSLLQQLMAALQEEQQQAAAAAANTAAATEYDCKISKLTGFLRSTLVTISVLLCRVQESGGTVQLGSSSSSSSALLDPHPDSKPGSTAAAAALIDPQQLLAAVTAANLAAAVPGSSSHSDAAIAAFIWNTALDVTAPAAAAAAAAQPSAAAAPWLARTYGTASAAMYRMIDRLDQVLLLPQEVSAAAVPPPPAAAAGMDTGRSGCHRGQLVCFHSAAAALTGVHGSSIVAYDGSSSSNKELPAAQMTQQPSEASAAAAAAVRPGQTATTSSGGSSSSLKEAAGTLEEEAEDSVSGGVVCEFKCEDGWEDECEDGRKLLQEVNRLLGLQGGGGGGGGGQTSSCEQQQHEAAGRLVLLLCQALYWRGEEAESALVAAVGRIAASSSFGPLLPQMLAGSMAELFPAEDWTWTSNRLTCPPMLLLQQLATALPDASYLQLQQMLMARGLLQELEIPCDFEQQSSNSNSNSSSASAAAAAAAAAVDHCGIEVDGDDGISSSNSITTTAAAAAATDDRQPEHLSSGDDHDNYDTFLGPAANYDTYLAAAAAAAAPAAPGSSVEASITAEYAEQYASCSPAAFDEAFGGEAAAAAADQLSFDTLLDASPVDNDDVDEDDFAMMSTDLAGAATTTAAAAAAAEDSVINTAADPFISFLPEWPGIEVRDQGLYECPDTFNTWTMDDIRSSLRLAEEELKKKKKNKKRFRNRRGNRGGKKQHQGGAD